MAALDQPARKPSAQQAAHPAAAYGIQANSPPVWYRNGAFHKDTWAARKCRNTRPHRSETWPAPAPRLADSGKDRSTRTVSLSSTLASRTSASFCRSSRSGGDAPPPGSSRPPTTTSRAARRAPDRKNTQRQFRWRASAQSAGAPPPRPRLCRRSSVPWRWSAPPPETTRPSLSLPPEILRPHPCRAETGCTARTTTLVARPWPAHASDHQTMISRNPLAGPQNVDQLAAACIHQRICAQKSCLQMRKLHIRNGDLAAGWRGSRWAGFAGQNS